MIGIGISMLAQHIIPEAMTAAEKLLAKLGQVQQQLHGLLVQRHQFEQFGEVLKPYVGSTHASHLAKMVEVGYIAYSATTVRRMIDKDSKTISLPSLLKEVKKHPHLLTFQAFEQRYPEHIKKHIAKQHFENAVGRSGVTAWTNQLIDDDIATLRNACKRVKTLVDKQVAHTQANYVPETVNWGQLGDAIDALVLLFKRTSIVLTGSYVSLPLESYGVREHLEKIWPPK